MTYPTFYPVENDVLPILFDTFAGSTGASITISNFAVADITIIKDGDAADYRTSTSGFTLIATDGIDVIFTGIHGFTIDLSDNTDAGFYEVGSWYTVIVGPITVDSQTVHFVAAQFRIASTTRGLAGTALPNAAADGMGGLPISDAGGLDLDAKLANTHEITAARMGALTDWIDGGRLDLILDARASQSSVDTIDGIVDTILLDTNELQTNQGNWLTATGFSTHSAADVVTALGTGSTLTAVPWNASWDTEVESEVTDALVVLRLDELLAADSDIDGAAPPTVGSVFHELMSATAGSFTFDQTTDSLEAIRNRGDSAWVTATGFSTHSAADVWAVATRVLTAATNISGPIADQVWEETLADHSGTVGSTAEALNAAGSAGDPWTTALPGAYGAGSAGNIIGNNLNATVSSRASQTSVDTIDGIVDTILLDTNELQTNQGNWLTATGFSTHSAADVWSVLSRTVTAATNITSDGSAIVMSSSGVVGTVNLVNTTTTNTDMRGTDNALLASSDGSGLTEAGGTGDHLTAINLPDQTMNIIGNITGNLSGSVGSVTGAVGSVTGSVTVGTNNDKTGYTLVNVDGLTFADYMESLLAVLFGKSVPSGSTVAFKKRDGTTTKVTVTYGNDDGERTGSTIP